MKDHNDPSGYWRANIRLILGSLVSLGTMLLWLCYLIASSFSWYQRSVVLTWVFGLPSKAPSGCLSF